MNFFECVILVAVGGPLFYLSYDTTLSWFKSKKARELNICSYCPPEEDSQDSENYINNFFKQIADERGIDLNNIKEWMYAKNSKTFIRVLHALGCEMVIRQVSIEDIEEKTDILKIESETTMSK